MCNSANLHFVYVLASLLLIYGDIEANPSPLNSSQGIQGVVSILHLNIRSIRHKLSYIFETLSDNGMLCFAESHLDERVTDTHLLSECSSFNLYRRDVTAHSSGIVVYVSNGLLCQGRLDIELTTVQSLWLELRYKYTCFLLCTTYRPPKSRVAVWDDFIVRIERAMEVNLNSVVVGDLSENLLNNNNTIIIIIILFYSTILIMLLKNRRESQQHPLH